MSTSPSWFDQEKFSKLVKKKAGSKTVSASAPAAPAARPPTPSPDSALLPPGPVSSAPAAAPVRQPEPALARTSQPLPTPVEPAPVTAHTPPPAPSTDSFFRIETPKPASTTARFTAPSVTPPTTKMDGLPLPLTQPTGTRSLPGIQRSTAPVPQIKSVFSYEDMEVPASPAVSIPEPAPEPEAEVEEDFVEEEPLPEPSPAPETQLAVPDSSHLDVLPPPRLTRNFDYDSGPDMVEVAPENELSAILVEKIGAAERELSSVTDQRDQARAENTILREQLKQAEMDTGDHESLISKIGELSLAAQERDEANLEVVVLRDQLATAEHATRERDALASQIDELSHAIEERDAVRHDYATLREQFENLKRERQFTVDGVPADGSSTGGNSTELQHEIESLRLQLASKEHELSEARTGSSATGNDDLNRELLVAREELANAKDEASVAQRGLALSQKALTETREALRQAGEGSSMSKGNMDNLKKECSTLVQQNMLLQAQHDQYARELSALKAKIASKS